MPAARWSLSLPPPKAQEDRAGDTATGDLLPVPGAVHQGRSPPGDRTVCPITGVSSGRSRDEEQGGRGSPTSEARTVDAGGPEKAGGETWAVLGESQI